MKTIVNKTRRPIKIPIPGGKFLHLGPSKTGQISDQASQGSALQKLVKAGDIEIVGEGSQQQAAGGGDASRHSSTHGHPPTKIVLPKGNR